MLTYPAWPMIGHQPAIRLLQRSLVQDRLAHAYLLTGPPNVGKTTLGLLFAQALMCEDAEARASGTACGVCAGCRKVRERTHPDLRIIEADGSADEDLGIAGEGGEIAGKSSKRKAASRTQIKIETIRELQRDLALRPYLGARRVVLIAQAEAMNDAAENALLKTLEEPPPYALLLLTAEEADHLLPTTVSRCQPVTLGAVPPREISQALIERGVNADDATRLARLSGGRVGWAISAARDQQIMSRRATQLDSLARVLKANRSDRLALAEELTKRPDTLPDLLTVWQGWWRDVLLTKTGCADWTINIDQQSLLDATAGRYGLETVVAALRATRQAADELEHNANPRLTMEVLFLSWPDT